MSDVNKSIVSKVTKLKSVRIPHWLVKVVESSDSATAEMLELMELGLIAKHGKDFVKEAKSK